MRSGSVSPASAVLTPAPATVEQVASAIRALGLDAEIVAGASPEPVEKYHPRVQRHNELAVRPRLRRAALDEPRSGRRRRDGTRIDKSHAPRARARGGGRGDDRRRVDPDRWSTWEVAILRAVGWSDAEIVRYVTADALLAGLFVEVHGPQRGDARGRIWRRREPDRAGGRDSPSPRRCRRRPSSRPSSSCIRRVRRLRRRARRGAGCRRGAGSRFEGR